MIHDGHDTGSELTKNLSSSEVQVDVSECTGYDGRCPLFRGRAHNFTLRFIPETQVTNSAGLERQIYAKFPAKGDEPPAEIPYGPTVSVNADTYREKTGLPLSKNDNQLTAGEWYSHNSIFPVIPGAPKVCPLIIRNLYQYRKNIFIVPINYIPFHAIQVNLTVRYLIREKIPRPTGRPGKRKKTDWRNQTGAVFACVEIPVEIIHL